MKTSTQGKNKIKAAEAFREYAYPDPASALAKAFRSKDYGRKPFSEIAIPEKFKGLDARPWTVGYGFTEGVTSTSRTTRAEANVKLDIIIQEYEAAVNRALKITPTQNQFDAMMSLAWNIGVGAFARSSVVKAHNRGDYLSASRAFGLFNMANGTVSTGLTARRAIEAAEYLKDDTTLESEQPPEMPQAVDGERSLGASSINKASVAAGSTALVAAADQINTLASLKSGVDSLGDWILPVLLVAIVGLCGYIAWQRYNQRKQGWA